MAYQTNESSAESLNVVNSSKISTTAEGNNLPMLTLEYDDFEPLTTQNNPVICDVSSLNTPPSQYTFNTIHTPYVIDEPNVIVDIPMKIVEIKEKKKDCPKPLTIVLDIVKENQHINQ